jgi:hypothetical protein
MKSIANITYCENSTQNKQVEHAQLIRRHPDKMAAFLPKSCAIKK